VSNDFLQLFLLQEETLPAYGQSYRPARHLEYLAKKHCGVPVRTVWFPGRNSVVSGTGYCDASTQRLRSPDSGSVVFFLFNNALRLHSKVNAAKICIFKLMICLYWSPDDTSGQIKHRLTLWRTQYALA
jgi:hypothetical protein